MKDRALLAAFRNFHPTNTVMQYFVQGVGKLRLILLDRVLVHSLIHATDILSPFFFQSLLHLSKSLI
jgi:hypothetical protein